MRGTLVAFAAGALILGAGLAAAQIIRNENHLPFESEYEVMGRVVDKDGMPASQMLLTVTIEGLRGVQVAPTQVQTDCFGDFGAFFQVGTLGGTPRVTVAVDAKGNANVTPVSKTQDIDKQFRRNDFIFQIQDAWPFECGHARDIWPHRVTVWGRIVRGVDAYGLNNTVSLTAVPLNDSIVDLEFKILPDNTTWRPDLVRFATDRIGDYQYSWIFSNDTKAGRAHVEVDGKYLEGAFDNATRLIVLDLNVGKPAPKESVLPGPGAVGALFAGLAAAVVLARPRARTRR